MIRFIRVCGAAAFSFVALAALSNPVILRDINTTVDRPATGMQLSPGATSLDFTPATMGGILYFNGTDPLRGSELWRSDGTPAGTFLVKEISPASNAFPYAFTAVGSTLFFFANDAFDAPALWKSDGTEAGTARVKLFPDTVTLTSPRVAGGVLFFLATDRANGVQLNAIWRSDGTEAGTTKVADIPFFFAAPVVSGNKLFFFRAAGLGSLVELWVSDGTPAGTVAVRTLSSSALVDVDGVVFASSFSVSDSTFAGTELWRSDGTAAGTVVVKDINPGFNNSTPTRMVKVGSRLFFFANDGTNGNELWVSDGTGAGTVMVKDITAGPGSTSPPVGAWQAAGLYFFSMSTPAEGLELWRSDGTAAGTFLVKDINPGPAGSIVSEVVDMGTYAYFRANDGVNGVELWKTDGTPAGTVIVRDILPGIAGSAPSQLTNVGGVLFFSAEDPVFNRELHRSDGTAAGTQRVADINSQGTSSGGGGLGIVNGRYLFSADDGVSGSELWATDGTAAGTVLVKDINPGSAASNISNTPSFVTKLNGALLMAANNGTHGFELWRSDGTAAGTFMLKDINPGGASSSPRSFGILNGVAYFTATAADTGTELWRTDGTEAGTFIVADLAPGLASSNAGNQAAPLFAAGNRIIFTATTAAGLALWSTDGTAAGTTSLMPLGTLPIVISGAANGHAFFTRNPSPPPPPAVATTELYSTNGTVATKLRDFVNEGFAGGGMEYAGHFYFVASDGVGGNELWRSDGSAAGTQLVKDIRPGSGSSRISNFRVAAGLLWFSATDGANGRELWRTDGTAAGTFMVADAYPGPLGSHPVVLGEFDGILYFSAFDPVNAWQVWSSDGTPGGTQRVSSLPGRMAFISTGSTTDNALPSGLVLVANDGVRGAEPWFLTAAADTTPDPFSFASITEALPGLPVTSATVTPTGYTGPASVSVLNGEYSVNCTGTFTSMAGTLAPGQSICVRHTASPNLSSGVTTTLDVGGTMATFTSTTVPPNASGAAAGDINGDGRADLVWVDASGNVQVGFMNGSSSGYAASLTLPANTAVADVADFNGDGRADLLLIDSVTGAVTIALFQGTGFASPKFAVIPEGLAFVGAARVNGSVAADLVWRDRRGGRFVVWTIEDGAIAAQSTVAALGDGWNVLGLGDVDGDGSADAVAANPGDIARIVRLGGSSPGTESQLRTRIPDGRLVGMGDMNGDGRADMLWQTPEGSLLGWLMNGAAEPVSGVVAMLPAGARAVRLLDLDADRKADVIVQLSSGAMQLWRLSGLAVVAIEPLATPGGGFSLPGR